MLSTIIKVHVPILITVIGQHVCKFSIEPLIGNNGPDSIGALTSGDQWLTGD